MFLHYIEGKALEESPELSQKSIKVAPYREFVSKTPTQINGIYKTSDTIAICIANSKRIMKQHSLT